VPSLLRSADAHHRRRRRAAARAHARRFELALERPLVLRLDLAGARLDLRVSLRARSKASAAVAKGEGEDERRREERESATHEEVLARRLLLRVEDRAGLVDARAARMRQASISTTLGEESREAQGKSATRATHRKLVGSRRNVISRLLRNLFMPVRRLSGLRRRGDPRRQLCARRRHG